MARLHTHTWCALILGCLVCAPAVCYAQKDPPCPLNMEDVLPAARFSGPLPCSKGATATEAAGKCEDIKGKVALIIGASTGLGRGVADRLAAAGMTVIGTSRDPQQYVNSCTYTKPGDRCKPVGWQLWQVDVTSQGSVDKLIQRVKNTYGRIDLLFLNAGRGYGSNTFIPNGKTWCNDISQMQLVMETNFFGPIRVLLAALPLIPRQGYARILVTASVAAWVNIQGGLPYAASKASAAVIGEEWLYEHYGPERAGNIKFTTIYPGSMLSDIARKSIPGCNKQADKFQNDWKQWEDGQYNQPGSIYITPVQGGEAVYRIAINPNPKKRYILNAEKSMGFMRRRLCSHLAAPMELWPKAYN